MIKHGNAADEIRTACETMSVTDRLRSLQTSGEAWKKRDRHSQVYHPDDAAAAVAGVSVVARAKTARGHEVRVMPSRGAHRVAVGNEAAALETHVASPPGPSTSAGQAIEPVDYSEAPGPFAGKAIGPVDYSEAPGPFAGKAIGPVDYSEAPGLQQSLAAVNEQPPQGEVGIQPQGGEDGIATHLLYADLTLTTGNSARP